MPKNSNSEKKEYSYEIFERPLSRFELTNEGEIAVWSEYMRCRNSPDVNYALQELLRRHDSMLNYLASSAHKSFPYGSDKSDKLQHARLGAMRAYNKFDLNKAETDRIKLSTYVQSVVYRYIQSANDEDAFVNCPPTRRMLRSYLSGRYDNDSQKLSEVEKRLQITTDEDRKYLQNKYVSLIGKYRSWEEKVSLPGYDGASLDDITPGDFCSEENLVLSTYMTEQMSVLSERQKFVLCNFADGAKMKEIAASLNVSEDIVRGDMRTIRKIMRKKLSADNKHGALAFH